MTIEELSLKEFPEPMKVSADIDEQLTLIRNRTSFKKGAKAFSKEFKKQLKQSCTYSSYNYSAAVEHVLRILDGIC